MQQRRVNLPVCFGEFEILVKGGVCIIERDFEAFSTTQKASFQNIAFEEGKKSMRNRFEREEDFFPTFCLANNEE